MRIGRAEVYLTLRIGVISEKLPQHLRSQSFASLGTSLFWFNEIEAVYAYLLGDGLDKLYIDRALVDNAHVYVRKYQKLIEQLYPRLEMNVVDFESLSSSTQKIKKLTHFPELNTLFKNGDLISVFQPIVEFVDDKHKIHGIECLSRFHFNGQNFAPDFIFNYAAEKLRLTNYDRVCLMQALSFVPNDKNLLIFINVRPQTLISSDFIPWFKSLLKNHQLLPEQIVIEVTEQYCNISEHAMSEQCQLLKNQGLRLAIDDFGSGISNLSMLETMKPSYLKISGRFIKNSHIDERKQKIIKNVLDLAHDFNIQAIVESVELKQEWQKAHALGARLAQGFYFFKPMDKESLKTVFNQAEYNF